MKYLLVGINAKYIHSNLAVYSLREYAKRATCADISIAEYTINMQPSDILRQICEIDADFIGISTYIWNMRFVEELLLDIKKIKPSVILALGGPEVSYDTVSLMERFPSIDLVMLGEGEETFAELIHHYEGKSPDLDDIKGICFRRNSEIVTTAQREVLDMSSIPFPYGNLKEFENKIIYYEASRGCPFRCSYCLSSVEKSLRFRDMKLVLEELQFFLNNKVKQVKFVDRTFNANPSRCAQILQFLKENDNNITNFHFEIAGDILTEEEISIINSMRPGLVQLEIGVQTTNEQTLCAINRKTDMKVLKENISRLLAPANVHIHLDLIAGLPFEDYDSFRNSFNEVYAMNGHELQLGFLKMLKGAPINDLRDEQGIVASDLAPYEVFSTKYLSYEDISRLKMCEEMLEIYHNSLQFTESGQYILKYEKSPFDFYLSLAEYYKQNGYLCIESKRARRYEILLDYFKERFAPSEEEIEELRLKLTLDYYKREKAKSRPDFAPSITRNKEINDFLSTHEEFDRNQIHIEPLDDEHFALFDYRNRSPVTGNTEYILFE